MIHDIDLVIELANSKVIRLAAVGGCSGDGPMDYVNATLGFENGVVASLTASKMSHKKIRSLSCLLYTSPSPRDIRRSRMPSSA